MFVSASRPTQMEVLFGQAGWFKCTYASVIILVSTDVDNKHKQKQKHIIEKKQTRDSHDPEIPLRTLSHRQMLREGMFIMSKMNHRQGAVLNHVSEVCFQ